MEAYNQRAAYKKHRRSPLKKMLVKSPAKPADQTKTVQPRQTTLTTTTPGNNTSSTLKTPKPAPVPGENSGADKPVATTDPALPLYKISPKPPETTEPIAKVNIKQPQLTQESLKKMTLEERRDTLQRMAPYIVLPPIQFVSDQDEFSVVNMDSFMQAMEYAQQGKVVLIEGHTDDLGSDAYNLKLSMKRAEKIRQLLLSGDISDELISVIGFGEQHPLVPNNSPENRSVNRRIEFKIFSLAE